MLNILIINDSRIPVTKYGGTERVIWCLGKELVKMGHKVSYLVREGSYCDFASVLFIDPSKKISEQIPDHIDIVHFNHPVNEPPVHKPHVVTIHANRNDNYIFDINTIFVSKNHAGRFGSTSYIYNGLDWDDYGKPELNKERNYFHFLGDASWRIKNVKGAINTILQTPSEKLKVLGGNRLNFRMGFRFTLSPRISFAGMVGGDEKNKLLQGSKGLIFPVRWQEPFGLAITESLYMGCPVFGTPYGSLPEIVNDQVGYLSNKSSELANAIQNVDGYSRQHCHEYALDTFNSRKMAEAYLERYQRVLNGENLNAQKPQLIQPQTEKFLEWS
jgi:glycosyltransferase involved in cell wall biosynthesis